MQLLDWFLAVITLGILTAVAVPVLWPAFAPPGPQSTEILAGRIIDYAHLQTRYFADHAGYADGPGDLDYPMPEAQTVVESSGGPWDWSLTLRDRRTEATCTGHGHWASTLLLDIDCQAPRHVPDLGP